MQRIEDTISPLDFKKPSKFHKDHTTTRSTTTTRELADIYPLLEADDMVKMQKPDWKSVFTYVQSFYRRFRDGRSPPKDLLVENMKQNQVIYCSSSFWFSCVFSFLRL